MSHKHGPRHKSEERDPIADYKEWTEHRYDPGYFVGGRLPPAIRGLQNSLSARDKRIILILLVILLATALGSAVWGLFRAA